MKFLQILTIFLALSACFQTTNAKKNPFKRVILLVQENHSFDNMLGFMPAPIGSLNEEVHCNTHKNKEYCQRAGSDFKTKPDPGHSYKNVNQQLYGKKNVPGDETATPTMEGFADNYKSHLGNPQHVFDCYTPEQVPILSTLAEEFTTYTKWFCSVPSQTYPNKLFLHAASSGGNLHNHLHYFYTFGYPVDLPTIQTQMGEEGYTWKVHWMDWNETFSIKTMSTKEARKNQIWDENLKKFYKDLEEGTLSDYTYLIGRGLTNPGYGHANDQHPSQDVRHGEELIKEVYEKFRGSQYWEDTLLLITYDEHGGFYDHEIPPQGVANPNPEIPGQYDFNFERLGIRVPAVAISPWLKKGVDTTQMEHASIPKTLHKIFDLKAGYLNNREAEANEFIHDGVLLDKMRTDCPETLPEVPFGKDELYPYRSRDVPEPELTGGKINYVQTLGSMLVNEGKLNMLKFEQIFNNIKSDEQAMQFAIEAQVILGFRPADSIPGFQYLSYQMMVEDLE